ncbi:MAG: DNA/RNA nuclease SfsA [Methanobacterium sp.]|nr:MAG: DNA/RNA nuclease SfsA [Methanobacterium sp.]
MIIPDILAGTFQERPNRFTVKFNMGNETELAHLRDPGRLTELLLPGVKLLLRPAQNTANRKTKYDVLAVLHEGRWVLINSGFHNDIAADLIESGLMDEFTGYSIEKKEYTYGDSRLDFLLANTETNEKLLLEVKGCTLVVEKHAKFPDAPTIRGERHLKELIKAKQEGYNSAVLFLIMRDDASIFGPNWDMDPEFSNTLEIAKERGVIIKAYSFKVTLENGYLKINPFKDVKIDI